ncbi:hypothetical protein [Xanthomonas cissicola]|nr:hypothetical protein [Xanthomonas cissicola]
MKSSPRDFETGGYAGNTYGADGCLRHDQLGVAIRLLYAQH